MMSFDDWKHVIILSMFSLPFAFLLYYSPYFKILLLNPLACKLGIFCISFIFEGRQFFKLKEFVFV